MNDQRATSPLTSLRAGDDQPSFEEALARLEGIVDRLESGEASLEESLQLFEEAAGLRKLCLGQLEAAEAKIKKLVESAGGEVEVEEFEAQTEGPG